MDSTSALVLDFTALPFDHPVLGDENGVETPGIIARRRDGADPQILVSPSGDPENSEIGLISNFTIKRQGAATRPNFLGGTDNLTASWDYPVIAPTVVREIPTSPFGSDSVGDTFGSQPVAIASVAYELKIMEGTFSKGDIPVRGAPPGNVVFDKVVNLSDSPIYLEQQQRNTTSITDNVVESGKDYTAFIRHLVWHPGFGQGREWVKTTTTSDGFLHFAQGDVVFFHVLTQYSIFNFRVNQIPSVSNLRVNGIKNPTLPKGDQVTFSFTVSDEDGPELFYRIGVGTESGSSFEPTIHETGIIKSQEAASQAIEINHIYTGDPLVAGEYFWQVDVQDGLAQGEVTDGTDSFRINSKPSVTSIRINGTEALLGDSPTVDSSNIQIAWTFSDADGDTQRAYALILSVGGDQLINTGEVLSTEQSVTIPTLPQNKTIEVSLQVKDEIEFGAAALANFRTNSKPIVSNLQVDGETNPGDVSGTTPTFSWDFEDLEVVTQATYRIQVARDEDFADLVWDTGVKSGGTTSVAYGSTASPVVPPEALVHGTLYYVGVVSSDGISDSDQATGFFSVNTAPGNPTLLTPSAGSYEGSINITWAEASPLDADGDTVTYTLEVTAERSFNREWQFLAGPFPSGTTSYAFDVTAIPKGDNYGVRVIASDGFAESDPSVGGTSARFSIANHPPVAPVILKPKSGDRASKILTVEWAEGNPVDIDGDPVFYELQLTRDATADDVLWENVGVFAEGQTKAFVDVSGFDDGENFRLRIRATDAPGDRSDFEMSDIFAVTNSVAITDFEKFNGILYMGSNDGRIFRAQDTIWQVDEDWSDQRGRVPFEVFVRGDPSAEVANGKLKIDAVPGTAYILRHSDEQA